MIDIIIAAYNSHKTIVKTLRSIANQENVKDLNVLIVDDCSDENYDNICNFFSDSINIKTIRLEKNCGPGVARQVGIENTKNEYIVFIDADDEFGDSSSILDLLNVIKGADIAFGQMFQESTNQILFHAECFHGNMYRRSFLCKNNIKFNSLRSHEDNAFNQLCLCTAKKVTYLEKVVYIYHNQQGSITNTIDFVDNIKLFIESMNWLFKNIEKQSYINKHYTGMVITAIMVYLYFCYIFSMEEYTFIPQGMGYLKKQFEIYREYINDSEELSIYKEYEIVTLPKITFYQFIDIIK